MRSVGAVYRGQDIEYLIVGHVTQDLTSDGVVPGGTAAFASLTVRGLGARPGIVTSIAEGAALGPLQAIPMSITPSEISTVFENTYTAQGRIQRVISIASPLDFDSIPPGWRSPQVLHLGPVADEVAPLLACDPCFKESFIGITPQGWMRRWGEDGRISSRLWEVPEGLCEVVDALVISEEDVGGDEEIITELSRRFAMMVVTRGSRGARLYRRGGLDAEIAVRPRVEIDPTGAGDIFAASFFWHVARGMPARDAAFLACELAGESVRKVGLAEIAGEEAKTVVSETFGTDRCASGVGDG